MLFVCSPPQGAHRHYFVLDVVFAHWRTGWYVHLGLRGEALEITTIQEAIAIEDLREGAGSRKSDPQHKKSKHEVSISMTLGAARHGGGYGDYEVPPTSVRVQGRGDVHEVLYVKCHAPSPPSPPYPPPSPRPDFPPAWWLISPPPPQQASIQQQPQQGVDDQRGHDGILSHRSSSSSSSTSSDPLIHEISKEVRHLISSGMGFLIVVLCVGLTCLGGLLIAKRHERLRELSEREAARGLASQTKPRAANSGRGGPIGARSSRAAGVQGRSSGGGRKANNTAEPPQQRRSHERSCSQRTSRAPPPKPGPKRSERKGATRVPTSEDAVPEDDAWVRDDDEDEEEGGARLERASEEPLIDVLAPEEEQEALAVAAHA